MEQPTFSVPISSDEFIETLAEHHRSVTDHAYFNSVRDHHKADYLHGLVSGVYTKDRLKFEYSAFNPDALNDIKQVPATSFELGSLRSTNTKLIEGTNISIIEKRFVLIEGTWITGESEPSLALTALSSLTKERESVDQDTNGTIVSVSELTKDFDLTSISDLKQRLRWTQGKIAELLPLAY